MYRLSDEQIDFILNDIKQRGVEMEDLQLNLLDHICCILEREMNENENFEQFYHKTIKTFFKHELWEIEEETIQLLTFRHFYAMKKTMIISGFLSSLLIIAGSLFKLFHFPGTGPLFVLGTAIFVLLFLPLMFVLKIKEKNKTREKVVLFIGMLVALLAVTSTIFKVMHWPMAEILKVSSILALITVFVPIYFFTGIRNPDQKTNTIVTTVLLIAGGGMLWFLTAMRPSVVLENSAFSSDIALNETALNLYKLNDAAYVAVIGQEAYLKKEQLKAFHKMVSNTFSEIDSIKHFLSKGWNPEYKYGYSMGGIKWVDYASSADWERPTHLLFGEQNANVNYINRLEELEKHERSQDDYYVFWDKTLISPKLTSVIKQIKILNEKAKNEFFSYTPQFNPILQVSRSIPDSSGEGTLGNGDWIMSNFYHVSQSVVMRNLTQLQLNTCLIEAAVLMKHDGSVFVSN
jgi:hypothetical protein